MDDVVPLKTPIICGAANNQLAEAKFGKDLLDMGITYVPDYVANAGGVIITAEQNGVLVDLDWSDPQVLPRLKNIKNVVISILERSKEEHKPTNVIADVMAEEIFLNA